VPLYNLMEDVATAEICRAQLWQWLRHGARLADGSVFTRALFQSLLSEERASILDLAAPASAAHCETAARLFEHLVIAATFEEFLTLPAYELLP
jgi:malate synthase